MILQQCLKRLVECLGGNIGRMIRMWERWRVMAHGMNRLKHYANYLPRLIILLNKTLPKDVADILKFNLLVCPSGRAGHFVAKDFFLEGQNFWVKFFYNNVVGRRSRGCHYHFVFKNHCQP